MAFCRINCIFGCVVYEYMYIFVYNATGKYAEGVNAWRTYLGVVQDLGLGGVRFEAQHSLSLVKLIFNSPRIHLFMAPSGGREREHQWNPNTRGLTPSCLITVPPRRLLFRPKCTRRQSRLCRSPTFRRKFRIWKTTRS